MKKLLLFFVSLATLLWLLTSCDSFKKNEVNPAPTTEVVNQAVVDLVKLYYPNATDIVIKEIVKDRVWSARFFVDDKEITLSVDNNNQVFKITTGFRVANLLLDVPDKIINYIKSNYGPNVTISRFSLLLDKSETTTHYVALVFALFDSPFGKSFRFEEMKFDAEGNYVGIYQARDFGSVLGNGISGIVLKKSFDSLPGAVQQFIKEKGIDKHKLAAEYATQSYSEASCVIEEVKYTKGTLFVIRSFKPLGRDPKTDRKLGLADDIFLKSDGTLLEWYGYRPNSTRGESTQEIAQNMILPEMKQGLDKLLGQGQWQLVYGLQNNTWFTTNSRLFKIEKKSEPNFYYRFQTIASANGDWNPSIISAPKCRDIKKQEDLPSAVSSAISKKLSNWKFVSGYNTVASVIISSGEERPKDQYMLIIDSDGKKYGVYVDVNDQQVSAYEL